MTTNEPTSADLSQQFAANRHWRWFPGMTEAEESFRVLAVHEGGRADIVYLYSGNHDEINMNGHVPSTIDPATLGCIEHGLVPEALGDPDACLCFSPLDRSWYVYSPKHDDCATSKDTKPAALLAALVEADDIVRRSTAGRVQVEDFGDPDDLVDDGFEDRDLSDYERDGYDRDLFADDPDEVPTDPKLCTRPPPAVAVTARAFLNSLQQRDADIEAKRRAKLRDKEPTP